MIVYMTTNLVNGKKYIGKDVKNNPKYLGSGSLLKKDILIFGKENFKKEILEYCEDVKSLEEKENFWISYYKAVEDNEFYNIRNNVKNWYSNASEEKKQYVKNKISNSNIGKKRNKSVGEKISKKTKGIKKGWKHTESSKKQISLKNTGNTHSEETKKIMKEKKKNFKQTEEGKKKISKAMKGFKHSEATKQKISNKLKGKKLSQKTKELIGKSKINNTNRRKTVLQYSKTGEFIKEWESALKAANFLGKPQGAAIVEVCLGKRKFSYGYIWKYKD